MKHFFISILLVSLTGIVPLWAYGQTKQAETIKAQLDSLANSSIPELNSAIDLSLTGIPLSEFVRSFSRRVKLNINIDPALKQPIDNNYSGIKAKDLINLLCHEYDLRMTTYGNIIQLNKHVIDLSRDSVNYDKQNNLISFDLNQCPLESFTQKLASKSPLNFFVMPDLRKLKVNGFAKSLNPDDALTGLGESNNFVFRKEKEGLYVAELKIDKNKKHTDNQLADHSDIQKKLEITDAHKLSVQGNDLPIEKLFETAVHELKIPFHQETELKGKKSLSLSNVSFTSFMNALVAGTDQTYKIQDSVLFLGARKDADMQTIKMIHFNYRRVDSLTQMLPKNIFKGIDTQEFQELNSIILIGQADKLADAESFFKKIDKPVPVVLIDVIILNVTDTRELETGITAGVASSSDDITTGGTLNPGVDFTMSSSSVNNLLSHLGLTNLGKVNSNFYVSLAAMDTKGIVDIKSTPQLSTLNGHSANMSIGETEYYKETSSTTSGSVTSTVSSSTSYKSIEANLSIKIEPYVIGNGDISMNISVEKSSFTERFEDDAPPGKITRKFQSMIRVKDQDMILLGGLKELTHEDTTEGMPLLSRIPILKWIFSSRSKSDEKDKFCVFIKPTVLY